MLEKNLRVPKELVRPADFPRLFSSLYNNVNKVILDQLCQILDESCLNVFIQILGGLFLFERLLKDRRVPTVLTWVILVFL